MIQKSATRDDDSQLITEEPPEPPSQQSTASEVLPDNSYVSPPSKTVSLKLIKTPCRSSVKVRNFRQRFFPAASQTDWDDWNWQMENRIRTPDMLGSILHLTDNEKQIFAQRPAAIPLSITPYYASLLDPVNPSHALRRTVVPTIYENLVSPGEALDPLAEDKHMPVPGIVHRYPDRVLFLVTHSCSTYCRYCTRSRSINTSCTASAENYESALAYIRENKSIRDVLISGGDPLVLSDDILDWILGNLKAIPHVEFIRIGTKVPAVLPQRITRSLIKVFRRRRPLWLSLHVTHVDELTQEMRQACSRLADAGVVLGSQTVLLAGINDTADTLKKLYHELLKIRVKPYYLYQCDPISGSGHFRTSVTKGLELIASLRGYTTGYAIPSYVIDLPGGGGKIPLVPDSFMGYEGTDLLIKNYKGDVYRYPDTGKMRGI